MTTHPCTDPRTGKCRPRGFLQTGPPGSPPYLSNPLCASPTLRLPPPCSLRTLAGEREDHCTNCGEANFFEQPQVSLQREGWRVARHGGAERIIAWPPPLAPESGSNPLATRSRHPGHYVA
jgi:hypothetical protein